MELEQLLKAVGQSNMATEDKHEIVKMLKTQHEGSWYESLLDDARNVLEIAGIDPKVLDDHLDLQERMKTFEYDYSGYNEAMQSFIESEAEQLGIDLKEYREG